MAIVANVQNKQRHLIDQATRFCNAVDVAPYQLSGAPQYTPTKPLSSAVHPQASKATVASVEIHDSSDVDISSEIEFPEDIMQAPDIHSPPRGDNSSAHATLVSNEVDDGIAFDPELNPDQAITIIVGKHTTLTSAANMCPAVLAN
ncbi:hypothetical protein IWW47_002373 [Coemansia sp. RSA 2052]|nr:hypothetical protein IWW47_002373 [Coemansia sp. RSA 2052]